jgi:superfamily II DNA or RNA helicase
LTEASLQRGSYEIIITRAVEEAMAALALQGGLCDLHTIDDAELPQSLLRGLAPDLLDCIRDALADAGPDGAMAFVNVLLDRAKGRAPGDVQEVDHVVPPARHLRLVYSGGAEVPERPDSPLSSGTLLTGTRLDPSLVSQLRKEMQTADSVDILCSFIKWGGIRVLEDDLRRFTAREDVQLRIITTSYMGATDLKAVEFLRALPKTTIRVSYDVHRTRLHAKAYLFHRHTGFGSAYIGSANMSQAALTDGLEWTVKVSQHEQSYLWDKATATFETYWNDAEFENYQADDRERLKAALEAERGAGSGETALTYHFDLRPYAFQQEILDRLGAERDLQKRDRHLVVAATGTGKTMVAAFDYRRWASARSPKGRQPTLLFVAHREEILRQSLSTFRAVLRDHNFGDLLVGGIEPRQSDHLFASIQSYNSRELFRLQPGHFDYVVIDEFHHAAAPSYERLLNHVRPGALLGLTATPERTDNLDIRRHFGGHVTAEIRLPDAINRKLLSPFQYFGITDSEDYSGLRWTRGGYRREDLEGVLNGNDIRAHLVIEKATEKLLDIRQARGLGFCVSVPHAAFMARKFRDAGIPAESLSSESTDEHRRTIQRRLETREINFIFVVDLYNEGVDIPAVDTVLLLRPTESLTVYLQQLGRGLRLFEGKDCLTVLDFIGQAHKSYQHDIRFRALLDDPTRNVKQEIEAGLPHLPAGCSVQLERLAKQYVLDNISRAVRQGRGVLESELRELAATLGRRPTFGEFLNHCQVEPDDVYRRGVGYSRLCADAGLVPMWSSTNEDRLTSGLRRLQHINSPRQIEALRSGLRGVMPSEAITERLLLMSHFSLWGREDKTPSLAESFERVRACTPIAYELAELLDYRLDCSDFEPRPLLDLPYACPLDLHGAYTRDEILAGLAHWDLGRTPEMREGTVHLKELNTDAFLFTLHKTERDYSPTTMYRDYAISEELFHWQSQSTKSVESPTGQRYIHHRQLGHTILLFAREYRENRAGLANPFFLLGPAEYVSHEGSRPMSITWRLRNRMPAKLYRRMARLAVL